MIIFPEVREKISSVFFQLMTSREEPTFTNVTTLEGTYMCRLEDNTFNPVNKYLLCPGKRFVFQYNSTQSRLASLVGATATVQQKLFEKSPEQTTESQVLIPKYVYRKENLEEFVISARYYPRSYEAVVIKNVAFSKLTTRTSSSRTS